MKNLNLLHFCLIVLLLGIGTVSAQEAFVISPSDVKGNRNAPANYDGNFKPGAMATVSGTIGMPAVRIVAKSGGIYKVQFVGDSQQRFGYYRANAVYPYFDFDEYDRIFDEYERVVDPFFDCYAQKHNITASGFGTDGNYNDLTAEQFKENLQLSMPMIAQLERELKSKLTARPNTFMHANWNPDYLEDIATNREAYLQCALALRESKKFNSNPWFSTHRDGIRQALKDVNEYDPATKLTMGTDSKYVLFAVSPKARTKWLTDAKALDFKTALDAEFAPLAEALNKKLPDYPPPLKSYSLRSPGEEAMMKRALGNAARYKIFSGRLQPGGWKIETNSLGIPKSRYKYGMLYVRDTEADHPYCHAAFVNIVQNYAGGGTYAASRAVFAGESLVACPAGK